MSSSLPASYESVSLIDPISMLRPKRKVLGMAAVLLPFESNGDVDWDSFHGLLKDTFAAGLVPAVNMDTGYANLIDAATRIAVLQRTQELAAGQMFVAGAFVGDQPGAGFNGAAYFQQIDEIQSYGGVPVIFQSFGLTEQSNEAIVNSYQAIAKAADCFVAFELGKMFAPFGAIYDLDVYSELMKIERCMGAKHSSLNRQLEWQRLQLRDQIRPEFKVLTGNDLAIDMIQYGSDYLLGLASFAPDLFAKRDQFWELGDPQFYELNDALQYLGAFAFRDPVPGYKHNLAQFLKLRGKIKTSLTHPKSPERAESDSLVLEKILGRLG